MNAVPKKGMSLMYKIPLVGLLLGTVTSMVYRTGALDGLVHLLTTGEEASVYTGLPPTNEIEGMTTWGGGISFALLLLFIVMVFSIKRVPSPKEEVHKEKLIDYRK